MRLQGWNRAVRAAAALAALVAGALIRPPCQGEPVEVGEFPAWTPLVTALRLTAAQGVPTVVVVTSRSSPASQAFCVDLARCPEARALAGAVQFAELSAEVYTSQVKNLNISTFPTFIVYRRGKAGLEAAGFRSDINDPRALTAWVTSLHVAAPAPAALDPSIAHSSYQSPSGQAGYGSEQQAPVPSIPPKQPPAYCPPPQQPVYAPQPQQPIYAPAPAPVYVQTQTPAMIVQQAPQQIILAPPAPPQVTVAVAPPVAYAAAPNLFTQPIQAMQPQPMMVAQPQPMMLAQPQPQPVQAAQAPATALVLQSPGLMNSLLGTLGERMARLKNPRVQMSSMPMLMQAPVGLAPTGYAAMPAGPPMAVVTPESTSFAPCNTFGAPCRYHGGPCPGPGPGYTPPPPPYPSASPQGSAQSQSRSTLFDWWRSKK